MKGATYLSEYDIQRYVHYRGDDAAGLDGGDDAGLGGDNAAALWTSSDYARLRYGAHCQGQERSTKD